MKYQSDRDKASTVRQTEHVSKQALKKLKFRDEKQAVLRQQSAQYHTNNSEEPGAQSIKKKTTLNFGHISQNAEKNQSDKMKLTH